MLLTNLKADAGLVLAFAVIAGMTGVSWQPLGAAQETSEKPLIHAAEKPAGKERRQPTPRVLKAEGAVWRMAWSPKGLLVTVSAKNEYAEVEEDGKKRKVGFPNTTVEVWQTATAQRKLTLGEEKKVNVQTLACSPDGKTAALGVKPKESMPVGRPAEFTKAKSLKEALRLLKGHLKVDGKPEYAALISEELMRQAIRTAVKSHEALLDKQERRFPGTKDYFLKEVKPICERIAGKGEWPAGCSFFSFYQLTDPASAGLGLRLRIDTPKGRFKAFALPVADLRSMGGA